MQIAGSTVIVTGSNRGLGAHLVNDLLTRDVAKIYAATRATQRLTKSTDPRVSPLQIDIDDDASVEAAAAHTQDATIIINNAGVLAFGDPLSASLDDIERDWRTNYLGTLRTCRAFVPVLAGNGGGAVVNVLTLIALAPVPAMAGYCASKAAAHSMTQSLRTTVRPHGITVLGAYPGGIDTDLLAGIDADKADPAVVAHRILDALEAGQDVVFPDDTSAGAGQAYQADPWQLETLLAG